MAMSDEDYRVFERHLGKYVLRKPCPICGTNKWQPDGPYVLSMKTEKNFKAELHEAIQAHFQLNSGIPLGVKMAPTPTENYTFVLLTCSTCYFTRQFNWLPIKSGGRNV